MTPARVTWSRTVGRAKNMFSSAVGLLGFVSVVSVVFFFKLGDAEGSAMPLAAVWALSVAPVLPSFAAFLAIDGLSEERRSGRMDVLLASAVREREIVLGKFLGVVTLMAVGVVLSGGCVVASLLATCPGVIGRAGLLGFFPSAVGLLVQGALWCAVSVAVGTLLANVAVAACTSVALTYVLPHGLWLGFMAWSGPGRLSQGVLPLDAHVYEMATGVIPLGPIAAYLVCTVMMLTIASKGLMLMRLRGRGLGLLRVSTGLVFILSLTVCSLAVSLAVQTDLAVDFMMTGPSKVLSARTRDILSETSGTVSVTCFLPRDDGRFLTVSRLLKMIRREAEAVGGARLLLQYVDPRWDIGASERLISRGVAEDCLVFEQGRRMITMPFKNGFGERACASALRRLVVSPGRRNVFWTVGHGEFRCDDYGAFGMSDMARELAQDGFVNRTIDLSAVQHVPGDCALIVIPGAKSAFSMKELGVLENYLKEGGRLLVLAGEAERELLAPVLSPWGVKMSAGKPIESKSLTGADVLVSEFAEHPISAALKGSRLVLENPVSLEMTSKAVDSLGVDRTDHMVVASVGDTPLAIAVERGGGAGGDLAIRPTRVVAVGDSTFVLNRPLSIRMSANRDFFVNCVTYLAGMDVTGTADDDATILATGLDRNGRMRLAAYSIVLIPLALLMLVGANVIRRRRS